jgi:EAL domain-containing protein (putative c-di-GMP-specific phosphodiesterase class I)
MAGRRDDKTGIAAKARSMAWSRRPGRDRRALILSVVPLMTAAGLLVRHPLLSAALVLIAQGVLVWWVAARSTSPRLPHAGSGRAVVRDVVDARLNARDTDPGLRTAAMVVALDDAARLTALHGARLMAVLETELANRLAGVLREHDLFCRLSDHRLGLALLPQRQLDAGRVLAVAQRIQAQLSKPYSAEGVTLWPTVSVGFCLSGRAASLNGIGMLAAAEQAALKALRNGPAGLSSYSVVDFPATRTTARTEALEQALETGEICAWFQPQIRTDTGAVSGLEALARWVHPERGVVSPGEFLPQIEEAGLAPRLTERMLGDALTTLTALGAQGFSVPSVSINLSSSDLADPTLAERILWDLDRHDLTPDRLTVEILETVVAGSDDDVAVRTIARLAAQGCGVDLDDFGTGHAAIANIRRFAVGRIKVDRSFVSRMHDDPGQQRFVAAILSMAENLGLDTVAEGVESAGEQVLLAQMGCGHLQGFAIARPMPPADLPGWLRTHDEALKRGEPACEDAATATVA